MKVWMQGTRNIQIKLFKIWNLH